MARQPNLPPAMHASGVQREGALVRTHPCMMGGSYAGPMAETPLHRDLVASLISHIALGEAAITRVAGRPGHPDPDAIGRHEPDVLALTQGGVLVIGEAKTGPDLDEPTAREQIEDFSRAIGPNGEKATFWLCVPVEYAEQARAAIEAHADQHYRVDMLTVAGLSQHAGR